MQHKAYLTSFFLFHLIFELLGIFMVMINIIKIELINNTENCWLNIFSIRDVFYQLNYFLSIPFSFGQDQSGVGGGGGGRYNMGGKMGKTYCIVRSAMSVNFLSGVF